MLTHYLAATQMWNPLIQPGWLELVQQISDSFMGPLSLRDNQTALTNLDHTKASLL